MDNTSASVLVEVAWNYVRAGKAIPEHTRADLLEVMACDDISEPLRHSAGHALRLTPKED